METLGYVIAGFFFGVGFTLASVICQILMAFIKTLYVKKAIINLKKETLKKNKPDDLHFGKGKDGKIL